ncbi:MAG: hypothetical protein KatS3mg111_1330 [Pirellulaceae bacterium]|nr:MAG: hypothetical protein KatS3mg111_1330 [Pirellulaceae bacterium]
MPAVCSFGLSISIIMFWPNKKLQCKGPIPRHRHSTSCTPRCPPLPMSRDGRLMEAHLRPTDPADQQPDPMSTVSQATWEVVIPRPGLYFIDARLSSTRRLPVRGVVIAAMEMDEPVRAGPFGWSVETLDGELPAEEIPELARQVGASWLKFPIWYDMSDVRQAERLVAFVEMLDARQIRCVGVIDAPPKEYRGQFGQANGAWLVYHYLQDPEVWEPLLEPVLTRLGMKVRWFQLGGEQDTSLRIAPDLSSILADIRRRIRTYAQDAKLSFVWEWIEAPPELGDTDKIDALQLVAMPPLTAEELRNLADAVPKGTATWVFINPLPKTDYDLYTRVIDLTERMIAVKEKEVEAAFVCNPADDSRGLLTDDGDAGEMLIPWHTLASAIGTGRSEGTIALPASSQNHIFSTERDGVMVLWNSEPVEEQLYFGDNITVHDIWGRSIPYETVTTSSGGQRAAGAGGTLAPDYPWHQHRGGAIPPGVPFARASHRQPWRRQGLFGAGGGEPVPGSGLGNRPRLVPRG